MHLVYIVRPGQNEELRYSIRSAVANLPVASLTIVGDAPGWVTGARHIPGNRHPSKPMNVLDNIRLAVTDPDLPDDVVIMNDDFFILEPLGELPVLYRGPLADHIAATQLGDWWRQSLERTATWLTEQGRPDALSYELHVPFPMNRAAMRAVLDKLGARDADNPPQWRTIYGNLTAIGGLQRHDTKLSKPGASLPLDDFASTTDAAFYFGAHRELAARFPHPSPFETTRTRTKEKPMTFYRNKSTGQVVENTTGELDNLARWEEVAAPLPPADDSEKAAEGDGVPKEGVEVPADGVERVTNLAGQVVENTTEPAPKAPAKPRARKSAAS